MTQHRLVKWVFAQPRLTALALGLSYALAAAPVPGGISTVLFVGMVLVVIRAHMRRYPRAAHWRAHAHFTAILALLLSAFLGTILTEGISLPGLIGMAIATAVLSSYLSPRTFVEGPAPESPPRLQLVITSADPHDARTHLLITHLQEGIGIACELLRSGAAELGLALPVSHQRKRVHAHLYGAISMYANVATVLSLAAERVLEDPTSLDLRRLTLEVRAGIKGLVEAEKRIETATRTLISLATAGGEPFEQVAPALDALVSLKCATNKARVDLRRRLDAAAEAISDTDYR